MQRSAAPPAPLSAGVWLKRGFIALLVIANVAVFALLFVLNGIKDAAEESIAQIPVEELPALAPPPDRDSDPLFVLLVGSDTRDTLPDDLEGEFGGDLFPGQRADVIMVFRVDPGEGRVQLVSLPRDLLVNRSDGGIEKINATYARDTNDLIEAVSATAGIAINHYVEVDFVGFANIVDALGGIDFYFALPSRDIKSGLDVPQGTIHMDGATALAYARSRSLEEFVDGNWRGVPGNDLERTKRQQELIFAILNEVKRPDNLLGMSDLVATIGEQITTDGGLVFDTLRDLAWDMRSFQGEDLEAVTLPVDFTIRNSISYVVPSEPEAGEVLAAFRAGTAMTGSDLRVEVRNGNGRKGAAGDFALYLESLGHTVAGVGNADRSDYPETVIITRPDHMEEAADLAAEIGFGRIEEGDVSTGGVDLVVYLGADAAGFGEAVS